MERIPDKIENLSHVTKIVKKIIKEDNVMNEKMEMLKQAMHSRKSKEEIDELERTIGWDDSNFKKLNTNKEIMSTLGCFYF